MIINDAIVDKAFVIYILETEEDIVMQLTCLN